MHPESWEEFWRSPDVGILQSLAAAEIHILCHAADELNRSFCRLTAAEFCRGKDGPVNPLLR